jgi:SAM-dependent methyltransferase
LAKITLFDDPNRHAGTAEIEVLENEIRFRGYQHFSLTKDAVRATYVENSLHAKHMILSRRISAAGKSVLDLGANAGFYSFWAVQNGAREVCAVDIDDAYLAMMRTARERFQYSNLRICQANVANWHEPADVVLALALVHWVYSCTAVFGSLESIFERMAELTRAELYVEWIAPEDPAIGFFHHLDWNPGSALEPYTLDSFESALGKHFRRWERIGDVSPTRAIYVATV